MRQGKVLWNLGAALAAAFLMLAQPTVADEPAKHVSPDNFTRAESDFNFKTKVDDGMFGKLVHVREPAPIDKQPVVRINRDTLFSFEIFDLAQPLTIIKPDTRDRFQSMLVINEDHYIKLTAYKPGTYELTRDMIGTRYVQIAFRTFVDPNSPTDVKAAQALQDEIIVRQASPGSFEIPNWDPVSQKKVRDGLLLMGSTLRDSKRMFGDVDEVDPVRHLIGTAGGFGGNSEKDAIYLNVNPEKNDANAYSFNNVTAKRDSDGRVIIHFGGNPKASNYLPIMKGWNYTVRLYQPQAAIVDGKWTFPAAMPVE